MSAQIAAVITYYKCSLHTVRVNSEMNILYQEKNPAGAVHMKQIADKQWGNSAQWNF